MIFYSSVQVLGRFPSFDFETIRAEQSVARVPMAAAMQAGPVHARFVSALPQQWRSDPTVEIFSRLLWLKKGFYPLAPHYHCDWYLGPSKPKVETLMVLLGDGSRTEFVMGDLELPDEAPGSVQIPNRAAEQIAEGVRTERLRTWFLEPEQLVLFDSHTWHRASPAETSGWRLLMRAIRGLPKEGEDAIRHRNPGPFTTVRNGYYPQTPEEQSRYEAYLR